MADRLHLWNPNSYSSSELADALLDGRIAGPVTSHDRANVRWKIHQMVSGDPGGQFGLNGLDRYSAEEVLAMVGREAGFDPDPFLRDEPVPIDPERVQRALQSAGRRLATAAQRGERVLLATGHPVGLILFYVAVARLMSESGASVITPLEGTHWRELGRRREVKYLHGVGVLTDRGSTFHTHSPGPMQRMLDELRPDLVFADHGFAGAAIEAGVETVSIADINDPALVVAKNQGRTETVIVMDDNVRPQDYWTCFQMVAAQFPQGGRRKSAPGEPGQNVALEG